MGDAQLGAVRLEIVARVLRAPVTVEDRARREVAVLVRHRQGRLRHLGVEGGPHRPADHRPGRQIEHDRQVEPALTGREGGDVPDCDGTGTIAVEGPLAVLVPTPVGDVRDPVARIPPGRALPGAAPSRLESCSAMIRWTSPGEQAMPSRARSCRIGRRPTRSWAAVNRARTAVVTCWWRCCRAVGGPVWRSRQR